MSFDYTFQFCNDEVFCAYTVPYTYSQMQLHIKMVKQLSDESRKCSHPLSHNLARHNFAANKTRSVILKLTRFFCVDYKFIRFESMGTSNGGMDIPILKISNKNSKGEYDDKPIVLIIGRQHSGETHSSFIIHGLINFLTSRHVLSHKMREKYEFWIAPIVNPDGVIIGNYRTNTQGKDMNRHFFADDDPEGFKQRLTEVEIIRTYLKEKITQKENLKIFLDIHAHSAQNSIFCYCPLTEETAQNNIIRRLPMILDNMSAYF